MYLYLAFTLPWLYCRIVVPFRIVSALLGLTLGTLGTLPNRGNLESWTPTGVRPGEQPQPHLATQLYST